MSAEFDALVAQATANESAEDAAATLIGQIAQKVSDLTAQLADSPTKQALTDLAAQLKTHADALGAAVAANTPAAPSA